MITYEKAVQAIETLIQVCIENDCGDCPIQNTCEHFILSEPLYRQGFEDGANADVDPNIKYIAVKDGTEYICGNCGAKLELEGIDGRTD